MATVNKPTIAEVRRVVRAAHPDIADLKVVWLERPRKVEVRIVNDYVTHCFRARVLVTGSGCYATEFLFEQGLRYGIYKQGWHMRCVRVHPSTEREVRHIGVGA